MFTTKQIQNVAILVKSGISALQQAGWSEAKIIAKVPFMVDEAVKFLSDKAAAQ